MRKVLEKPTHWRPAPVHQLGSDAILHCLKRLRWGSKRSKLIVVADLIEALRQDCIDEPTGNETLHHRVESMQVLCREALDELEPNP